jgi:hypothetical protein
MKNVIKLFVAVSIVAVLMFASCEIEYGGTIEVKNNVKILEQAIPIVVTVTKVGDSATDDNKNNKKTIPVGGTEKWHFDKDASYTVACPTYILYLPKVAILFGGNTVKYTIQ